jgi:cysteine synthase
MAYADLVGKLHACGVLRHGVVPAPREEVRERQRHVVERQVPARAECLARATPALKRGERLVEAVQVDQQQTLEDAQMEAVAFQAGTRVRMLDGGRCGLGRLGETPLIVEHARRAGQRHAPGQGVACLLRLQAGGRSLVRCTTQIAEQRAGVRELSANTRTFWACRWGRDRPAALRDGLLDPALGHQDVCQAERGLSFVHPFDDTMVMAGHSTVGLELLAELPQAAAVVVPIGGGGLIGGVASAAKAIKPEVNVIGVEPVGAEAMTRALGAGRPVRVGHSGTIADGLDAPFVGVHTLAHARAFVDQIVLVTDAEIVAAQRYLFDELNLTVEPAGAASVAGVLTGAVQCPARTAAVCIVSGGNIDPEACPRAV